MGSKSMKRCANERCQKRFKKGGNNHLYCCESCRSLDGYYRRKGQRAQGIIIKRIRRLITCTKCGRRMEKRTKYGLCRQCLAAQLSKRRDDLVFWAIVEFKTANRGTSPKHSEIAPLAGYSIWMVDRSVKSLEASGRINCIHSKGGARVQFDIPGSRWVYEGAEEKNA